MERIRGRMLLLFMHSLVTAAVTSPPDEGPTAYPQTTVCCDGLQDISEQCYSACLSLGTSCESSLENAEQFLLSKCGQIPDETLVCLNNNTMASTPQTSSTPSPQLLACCQMSSNPECVTACTNTVMSGSNSPDELFEICGPPLSFPVPADPVYKCFLLYTDESPNEETKTVTSDTLCPTDPPTDQPTPGADLARLQCCTRATDDVCQEACMKVFSLLITDDNYNTLLYDCLHRPSEAPLVACLDDVSSECNYGCSGLYFCSSLNLKSHSLYRRCNKEGDAEAKHLYYQWLDTRRVDNPLVPFVIKDPTECMPSVWKEVACATATKPCHPDTHTSLICRDDCMQLMKNCSNDTVYSPGEICDILSPPDLQENCIPLASLTEEPRGASPMEVAAAASPCNSNPCADGGICYVNRDCQAGDFQCVPYTCLPPCELGGSTVLKLYQTTLSLQGVDKAHVFLSSEPEQHCYGYVNKTEDETDGCKYINEAEQQYCENVDLVCHHEGQAYAHNEVFDLDDCNFCQCYYGRLVCSNISCPSSGNPRIPCDCPAFYFEPVCTPDGRTFPNSCYARCNGYDSSELESGQCGDPDPCLNAPCPTGSRCVPHRHVCFFGGTPSECPQYLCEPVGSECSSTESVCDKNGNEHNSLCDFVLTAEKLDYWGHCREECSPSLRNPVCGVNGETFDSKCHAQGGLIAVDYSEECNSIPRENGECLRKECSQVLFSSEEVCIGPTPPGACCPKCGGLVRVLMDETLLRRNKEALGTAPFISTTIIEKLRRMVDTRYCDLFGHVGYDGSLNLLVLPENGTFWFNVETCNTQARSLAALINTRSPVLRSDPFLAHLVVANTTISYKVPYVHTVATESVKDAEVSGCSQVGVAFQTLLLSLVLCLLNASIR